MEINFREALTMLYRALPLVLFRAGVIAAGGCMIIVIFGMLLFTFRLPGGTGQGAAIAIAATMIAAMIASGLGLRRFFLFRLRAAMLFLFSGSRYPVPPLSVAVKEAGRQFKNYSQWQATNRWLRLALHTVGQANGETPRTRSLPRPGSGGFVKRLTDGPVCQAILVLAFSRGNSDFRQSAREGAALYLGHGVQSVRLAKRWLWLSAVGFLVLFFCLALPNWFFFSSAGAPVWLGIVLAALIAWVLYQAFLVPVVLAGVSAALLAESREKSPDRDLCDKISSLIPAAEFSGKSRD